jgi:hypothetical protein
MVANAGQVLHPSAPYHDNGMLLQVVPYSGDIGSDLITGSKFNPGYFSKRRIRLFRSSGVNTNTDATTLRTGLQSRALGFHHDFLTPFSNQLAERWQAIPPFIPCLNTAIKLRFLTAYPGLDPALFPTQPTPQTHNSFKVKMIRFPEPSDCPCALRAWAQNLENIAYHPGCVKLFICSRAWNWAPN